MTKDILAERLRVAQDFGTADEIADALDAIVREKDKERKDAARQAAGLVHSLEALGEKIAQKRVAEAKPESRKRGAGL